MFRPPKVRVAVPSFTSPPAAPPPASEPMVLLNTSRSSVAPAALPIVTAELLPKALVVPAFSVPPLTVVAPV